MTENLYIEMNRNVMEWYKNPPCCQPNNLYMVLIAHNKAVLFVIQLDMNCVSTHLYIFFMKCVDNFKDKKNQIVSQ